MDKEEKVHAIQKALEEATALELPMLSKNMVVISTHGFHWYISWSYWNSCGDDPCVCGLICCWRP